MVLEPPRHTREDIVDKIKQNKQVLQTYRENCFFSLPRLHNTHTNVTFFQHSSLEVVGEIFGEIGRQ